jgi:sugar lactone lactonase YvrE
MLAIILLLCATSVLVSSQGNSQVSTLTEEFDASGDVAVDSQGFIYVANYGTVLTGANGTEIYKIDPADGSITLFADGIDGAAGNEFDSKDNLFQSNISAGIISKITPDGEVTTFATSGGIGPTGIAIDSEDNLFVAHCNSSSIQRISADGTESEVLIQDFRLRCPNGLTMDDLGNLYAANFNDGNIIKITLEGELSILATLPGSSNAHITFANGVLYVTGRGANQIFEVTLNGEASVLAGSGVPGNADGPALQATLSKPNGIATSPDGRTLYFNDAVPTDGVRLTPVLLRSLDIE